jgi:hypothetical protein
VFWNIDFRTESIYYTPDATSDKLEELTLQWSFFFQNFLTISLCLKTWSLRVTLFICIIIFGYLIKIKFLLSTFKPYMFPLFQHWKAEGTSWSKQNFNRAKLVAKLLFSAVLVILEVEVFILKKSCENFVKFMR